MKKKLLYLIITAIFSFQFMANPFTALALEENIATTEPQTQENGIVNNQVTPSPETENMNNSNLSVDTNAIPSNETTNSTSPNLSTVQNAITDPVINNGNTELDSFLAGNETSKRISGADRYEAAINVSKLVNNSSEKVILVSSANFQVALASSNLIDSKYPVLFVDQNLSANTLNEIKRLNANEVFLVGDEKLIPKSVEDQLAAIANLKITRFTGTDNYDICRKTFNYSEKKNIMMTSGTNFTDPLLAAPLLSDHGLLLTDKSSIPSPTIDVLSKLPGADFEIIGGPLSVSNDVENLLSSKYGYNNIERTYSSNRFTTSVKVAEKVKSDYVIVSSSVHFNDALAASIISQKIKAPILYVSKDQVDNSVRNYIKANNFKKAIFIGGDLSISQKTSSEIEALIKNNSNPAEPDPNPVNVDDNTELKRFLDSNLLTKRITGATRYDAAVNVSKFENNTSEKVILVNSKSFPEALASSNLIAGKYPILYVDSSLTENTINEIRRLNPKEIYILGNESLIPKSVEYEIDNIGYIKITRFSGSNPYDMCEKTFDYSEKKNFILTSGQNFTDPLLAAPLLNDFGLLTTQKDPLSKDAESSMTKLTNPAVKIIGGPLSVSNATQNYLSNNLKFNNIDRTYDTNRFTTSVRVAEKIKSDYVIISSSVSFNDALAASTLAQKTKAPILYVSRYNIDNSVINYFKSRNIKKAIIIGGNLSVSENTANNIERLIKKQDVVNNKAPTTLSKYAVSKSYVNIFSDSKLNTKTSSMPTKKIVEVLAQTDYEAKIKYNKTIGWVNKDSFYNYDRVKFGKVVTNVPYVSQLHPVYAPNGCEPTSMLMALKAKGYTNLDLRTYLNRMPKTSSNPRYGFVGSPYGNESYRFLTIDPEPLAKYGNVYAKGNVENIQGSSIDKIIIELQNGNPVVAYETLFWNRPYFRTLPIDGIPTTRIFNNHVVLLTGYDPVKKSFYVADPYNHEKAGASRLMPFYYWKSQTVVDRCYNYDSRRFAVVIR